MSTLTIVEQIERANETDQVHALQAYTRLVRKPQHSADDATELRAAMRVLNITPEELRADLEARRRFARQGYFLKSDEEIADLRKRQKIAGADAEKAMQRLAGDMLKPLPMDILKHLLPQVWQLTIQYLGYRANDYLSDVNFADRHAEILGREREAKSAADSAESGSSGAYQERARLKREHPRAFASDDDPAAADGAEGE